MAQSETASMGGPFPIPEPFHRRPAVATLIYVALHESEASLPVATIAESIGRSENTIRHHTRQLADVGLIAKYPDRRDGRRNIYSLP